MDKYVSIIVVRSVWQYVSGARGTQSAVAYVDAISGETVWHFERLCGEGHIEYSVAIAAKEMCVGGEVGIVVSGVGVDVELCDGT